MWAYVNVQFTHFPYTQIRKPAGFLPGQANRRPPPDKAHLRVTDAGAGIPFFSSSTLQLFNSSAAQIGATHTVVVGERSRIAAHGNAAGLQHVGTVGDLERHFRVLLDQQNGRAGAVQLPHDV